MMINKRPVDVVDISTAVSNSNSQSTHHSVRRTKRRRVHSDKSHRRQGSAVLAKEENSRSKFSSEIYQCENLYQNVDVYLQIMEDCKPFYNLEENPTDQSTSLPPRLEDGLKNHKVNPTNQLTITT
mmetsp:Transcript_5520/g.8424  ORF Transcript_5520/g.8424 Transcript_5520/m.8424 type:complete len:126 (+) Transcript_5520:110-487(+)